LLLARSFAQCHGQPAGHRSGGEPERQSDQRAKEIVGDEEDCQQPARSGRDERSDKKKETSRLKVVQSDDSYWTGAPPK